MAKPMVGVSFGLLVVVVVVMDGSGGCCRCGGGGDFLGNTCGAVFEVCCGMIVNLAAPLVPAVLGVSPGRGLPSG